ncbi:MAG: insulinase family protein, partial [Saprospiraceae bacterium]|nr:insulinase family protein [Saprospiraceae bacterium]
GMLILEDWAQAVAFEDEEIDNERGVVESELRSGLSADERMRNEYLPVIFYQSKYADRLPIGTREIINGAPYDALKRFYRDWYRPDLMALVVVGDVDVEEVEKDIRARFSKLKNPAQPRAREKFGFPNHTETLVSISKDKEASFTRAQIIHKHPHKKVTNLEDFRSSQIRNLYNRMLSDRLNELRQSADPPFLFANSGYGRFVGDLDTYSSTVVTGEGQLIRGLRSVFEENRRVLLHGFTSTELERVKTEMLSEAETTAKEEDKLESGRLSMQYVYHFLNENPVPSPQQRLQLMQAFFPTIGIGEVNALASEWITDENKVIVITGPDKEDVPLPAEDAVLELVAAVEAADIEAYEDDVMDEPLLAEPPAQGSVTSENYREQVGVTEWVLSNGVKVILRPTDFQNDEIVFNAFSPGGSSLYADEDFRSASIAATIINQSGIADFDLIQLQKQLAGKVANASPFIGELEEGLQGFSTIKDLETMFQLIYLYFYAPREDSSAFASFVNRQRQVLQNLFVNPDYYFRDRISDLKYSNHPRRGIPRAEEMDQIRFDKVMEIYRDRFADASDFTFTFVGNFTVESIKPLVLSYLASLPSTNRQETWKDVGATLLKGTHEDHFSYGEAPKAQINLSWHGAFDWDVREDRYHFNAMLEVMRNVLRESMREDAGGVYGVRVAGNVSKFPKEGYSVTISF